MRRISINTLVLLANNMISAALAFAISVIIGRSLGADGLGQYSFISAWIAPLVSLADFGMGSLITRDVAQNNNLALVTLRTATRALLFVAVPLLIVTWIVIPTLSLAPALTLALALMALLIILDPWFGLYTASFRAFQKMWPILIINVGGLILQLGLIIVAIHAGLGLVGIAAMIIVVNVLQLVATWGFWKAYGIDRESPPNPGPFPYQEGKGGSQGDIQEKSNSFSLQKLIGSPLFLRLRGEKGPGDRGGITIRRVLSRAWPFALAALLNTLQLRLNILLLENRAGDTAVGLYSAASRFVEAGRLVPGALFGALFPALSSLVGQPLAMRQTFIKASAVIAAFGVAFGLAMTLLGGFLIQLTYGHGFETASPVLAILSWALLPSLLRGVLTLYLYSLSHEHFVNVVTLVALGCQAVIGWLAIGQYGVIGAAVSIGIVEGGICLCLGFALRVLR